MTRYRHIIFDIDGTLLDTEAAILQSLRDTLAQVLHRDVPAESLKFALGIPGDATLRQLGVEDVARVSTLWGEHLQKHRGLMRPFEGIPRLVAALKADGYALGIVTSKTRREFVTDFEAIFDSPGSFGISICADDVPRPKPYPDPLLAYLAQCSISPREALYIGDAVYDSRCAQGAGVDFALARWGNTSGQAVPARYVFACPADALRLLAGTGVGGKQGVYSYLDSRGIRYEVTEHRAVFNMAGLLGVQLPYPAAIAKNLFARDDKKQHYYLFTLKGDKRMDLKAFRRRYGTRPLSLASGEELQSVLGLMPGAVSPLGLLNDRERRTHFFLDADFLLPPAVVGVHPNDNTATLWLNAADLLRLAKEHGNAADVFSV